MQLFELIKARHNSQTARASTLSTLRNNIYPLDAEGQEKVVVELISDLRASLRTYRKHRATNHIVGISEPNRRLLADIAKVKVKK